eukprot:TRINITY_DN28983_c0_g1_i1.p1 TRINITY_DN28983_c0_g1~~TRINITY_DN28983_c0_g1_i1.p1  ORF type:complete len:345 (+),score=53.05 TRINITY_DN28983_c0_g1_i1:37-1071(+)
MYQDRFGEGIGAGEVEDEYFGGYGDVSVHRVMVNDAPRMKAYREGVKGVMGMMVVDVGAGSGVLSLMAAKEGAKRVYAVEAGGMADILGQIVVDNKLDHVITVIKKRVEEVTLEDLGGEKADVILSEWMGFYLLHESMLPSVLWARDNLLKHGPNGVEKHQMLPCAAEILIAGVDLRDRIADHVGMWGDVDGFDLSAVKEAAFTQLVSQPLIDVIDAGNVTSDVQTIASFDLCKATPTDLASLSSTHSFRTSAPTSGVCIWFTTSFYNHFTDATSTLTTSPMAPPTHWKQTTIFLPIPTPLNPGSVQISTAITQSEENARCYELSIELLDYEETATHKLLAALR